MCANSLGPSHFGLEALGLNSCCLNPEPENQAFMLVTGWALESP